MRKHYRTVLTLMIVVAAVLTALYFNDFFDKAGLAYAEIADNAFSAKLESQSNTAMEGEYVSFTLRPEGGMPPYHDAKLFCGDGTTIIMQEISSGPLNSVYGAQCRYAAAGKYEAYAEIHDSRKDPSLGTADSDYNRAQSNRILLFITPRISITSMYIDISVSELEVLEYEPITVTIEIHGAEKPYRNITIYCGRENIIVYDYDRDIFAAECVYAVHGEYEIYAEAYDFTYTRLKSYTVPVTVLDRPRDGGGGTGACFPRWECTEWGRCEKGQKTRTCTDIYNCDWDYKKPEESASCVSIKIIDGNGTISPPIVDIKPLEQENQGLGNGWIFGLFVVFIIISGYAYFKWAIPERKRHNAYIKEIENAVERARNKGHSDIIIHKNLAMQGHKKYHIRKAMKKRRKK